MTRLSVLLFLVATAVAQSRPVSDSHGLCLDNMCIGQSISDPAFGTTDWIVPNKELAKQTCQHVKWQADVAFRGYGRRDAASTR